MKPVLVVMFLGELCYPPLTRGAILRTCGGALTSPSFATKFQYALLCLNQLKLA